MSKFTTVIPLDVDAAIAKLPAGARVNHYNLVGTELHVQWEHDNLCTAYSVPMPYPIEDLMAGKVPSVVTRKAPVDNPLNTEPVSVSTATPLTITEKLDKPAKNKDKARK